VKYRLTVKARRDVLQIWSYIADDNETAADNFLQLLTEHFGLLGKNPYAGRSRDHLGPGYRGFPVGQYIILYRVAAWGVEILHVLHGKRDLGPLLKPE
jgi:toxin ParE1/3/4